MEGTEVGNETFNEITRAMEKHYTATFEKHGATSRGVDWGAQDQCDLRYAKMLEVFPVAERQNKHSVLDVGCGFGGLLGYAEENGFALEYTGIDVSQALLTQAQALFPKATWIQSDVLKNPESTTYDYVICNGILTQKLKASHLEMNAYSQAIIRKLFALCRKGVAFNVMSTQVNFQVDNLFYKSPVEMFAFCMSEVTRKVRLDHAYPLYEYTVFLYR